MFLARNRRNAVRVLVSYREKITWAGLPTQIGYRTTTFEFEGVSSCAQDGVEPGDLMDAEAVDLLAERLRTALQIEMHLTVASG